MPALNEKNHPSELIPYDCPQEKTDCTFIFVEVMESLEHALHRGAPILAEYLGGAVTCDAYHMTDPRADGLGVSSCIEKSLEDAGVSPEEVCPSVS